MHRFPPTYRPLRALGRGTTAEVFLADGARGEVAVKLALQPGGLHQEREVLARVTHPHLAHLLDADPAGDWLVLEYAAQGRADGWARGQPTPSIVEIAAQVAEALDHLHGMGLVHGDLKPSNVLVTASGSARLVGLGHTGAPGGPAADLYGLGAVLYQLLTRHAPFQEADPAADPETLEDAQRRTLPAPPSALKPRLPRSLDDLVMALLARAPALRPGPAAAVAVQLRAATRTQPRPPMVGMARERDILRRHIVELLDGKPTTVVLHGNPGSGRRTLIRECVRAAQREGVRAASVGSDRRKLMDELSNSGPSILALDGNAPGVEAFLVDVLARRPPCLLLVRADRPMMQVARLGGRHLSPGTLTVDDVTRLFEGLEMDRRRAEEFHRASRGSPGTLMGLALGASIATSQLDPLSRRVLTLLSGSPQKVASVAQQMGLSEHGLLDLVEPMIDQGLLTSSADGAWLRGTRPEGA